MSGRLLLAPTPLALRRRPLSPESFLFDVSSPEAGAVAASFFSFVLRLKAPKPRGERKARALVGAADADAPRCGATTRKTVSVAWTEYCATTW
jgi:hypothetical protein